MDLQNLSILQDKMDGTVEERFGIQTKMIPERVLACLGELSEVVDAWRRSKFWSQYNEPKESLLEEYVDTLHFLLSICNKYGVDYRTVEVPSSGAEPEEESYEQVRKRILHMYAYIANIGLGMPEAHFSTVLEKYLELGIALGFSTLDIEQGYELKNTINLRRQKENY